MVAMMDALAHTAVRHVTIAAKIMCAIGKQANVNMVASWAMLETTVRLCAHKSVPTSALLTALMTTVTS